jgi:carboxylesterase
MQQREKGYFSGDECSPFFYKGGEKGIVFLHGFTGSVAHMRPLGDTLHKHGYSAMGINLPGHATTEEDMASVGRREWLQAALDAVAQLRKHCQTVAVCGLSMGAVLSMLIAEQHKADACVSISAPLPAFNRMLPLTRLFSFLHPRITWKQDENRILQLDQRYDKGYTGFPTRKGADLYALIKQAQRNLPQITCPTLVIQSQDDHTVSPSSADTILGCISSMQKEKLILHGVPHVCTISGKLTEIANAIDALMRSL